MRKNHEALLVAALAGVVIAAAAAFVVQPSIGAGHGRAADAPVAALTFMNQYQAQPATGPTNLSAEG